MRFRFELALGAVVCFVCTAAAFAAPVGNVFTYQGRLNQGGVAVTVPQDLEFRLYDAASAGTLIGGVNGLNGVAVTHGLFSVPLDFGAGAFGNEARYLEIQVRPSGSGDAFTALTPRQPITPAPVALSVAAAGVDTTAVKDGAITRAKLSADFTPILVAKSSYSQVVYGPSTVYFDSLVKSAGFFGYGTDFAPMQTGYYMVSISLPGSPYPGSSASVSLLLNGVSVQTLGSISETNPFNVETWLDLAAYDTVSVRLESTGPYSYYLDAGAQLRIVRLD